METFVAELGLDRFEHIADTRGLLWTQFDVEAQPAYVFINQDGAYTTQVGALDAATFDAAIEGLIAE